jgi:hypothetical protein
VQARNAEGDRVLDTVDVRVISEGKTRLSALGRVAVGPPPEQPPLPPATPRERPNHDWLDRELVKS